MRTSAEDLAAFLRARVSAREFTFSDVSRTVSEAADLLAVLLPAETPHWRRAITIVWLAVAAADVLRAGLTSFAAAWSFSTAGGTDAGTGDADLVLPTPPDLVGAELAVYFGAAPPRLELGRAVDYLVGQGPGSMLAAGLPDLAAFFASLADATGLTPGDLIASALQGALTADLGRTALYRTLRDVVRGQVDGVVLRDQVPALRAHALDLDDRVLLRWLDEVAEPGLLLLSGFVFERLDAAAAGALTGDLSPFTATFRTALSVLVGRLVTLNVVVLAEIALEAMIDQLHGGLRGLAGTVRADPSHAVALAAPTFVRTLLPTPNPAAAAACRDLAADLLDAAADGFGPTVWTPRRKEDLLDTVRALLESVAGHPDFADRPAFERFLAEVAECQYVPDGDRLVHLLVLQAEILGAAIGAALPATLEALRTFALRVTTGILEALEDDLRAFLDDLDAALNDLWNALQAARRRLERRVAELQAAARAAASSLEAAADVLRARARRQEALDRLVAVGLARSREAVRALPGFELQPPEWQQHELAAAAAFFTTAFDTARPIFDVALGALAPLADDLGDLLNAAADLPDLLERLGEEAEQAVVAAANDALGTFGLALPQELSIGDIVDAVRWVLTHLSVVRDALRTALTAAGGEATARTRRDTARAARDQARDAHAVTEERLAAATPPVRVRLVSPLPVAAAAAWTYGRDVPVVIELDGATPAFLDAAQPLRTVVALNGVPINVPRRQWRETPGTGLRLQTVLSTTGTALRAGVNVLECSVAAAGRNASERRGSVAFVLSPRAARPANLTIDEARSVFGRSPGGLAEKVVIVNTGATSVDLSGWRLADEGRHTFVFPRFRLPAGRSVTVHTGQGRDTGAALHWGRRSAVWRTSGGIVHLVDGQGVLATFLRFGGS